MVEIINPDDGEHLEEPADITIRWTGNLYQGYEWALYVDRDIKYRGTRTTYDKTVLMAGEHDIKVIQIPEGTT